MRRLTISWAFLLASVSIAYAQEVTTHITPTGGVGDLGTTVTQAGSSFDITGGTRPDNGPNLFHGFGQFSVGTGDIANFANDSSLVTQNILSRVTGGSPSEIFGTLQTTGFAGADLYLLNPSGVLFGPTASLNVEGGFHVTTADFIELADGVRFDAVASPNDALLSVAPPSAFGFLDDTTAPIEVRGSALLVPNGDRLSLVGGDVKVSSGALLAANQRVDIASVTGVGEAVPTAGDLSVRPLPSGQTPKLGNIDITQGSSVFTTGGEGIFVRAGRFTLVGDSPEQRSQMGAVGFEAAAQGPGVKITADDSVTLRNAQIQTLMNAPGDAGDLSIETRSLNLLGNALLVSAAPTQGKGGDILLGARELISVTGESNLISTTTDGTTNAGDVRIASGSLLMENQNNDPDSASAISSSTLGDGNAGEIILDIDDTVRLSGNIFFFSASARLSLATPTKGNAGAISVSVRDVIVEDGAAISSSNLGAAGRGGDIRISAGNSVTITGRRNSVSPSVLASDTVGTGAAGTIEVDAPTLKVTDGARISAQTLNVGDGGRIVLDVGELAVSGGADIATGTTTTPAFPSSGKTGAGGNIEISARAVTVEGFRTVPGLDVGIGSVISTSSGEGGGDAGNIRIHADSVEVRNGGIIEAATFSLGKAGDLAIQADTVHIEGSGGGLPARLSVQTFEQGGDAGDLSLTVDSLQVLDGGLVVADSFGSGRGGNLRIEARTIDLGAGALIAARSFGANSDAGESGSVFIRAADSFRLFDGARISVETNQADAGDIGLDVGFLLHLRDGSSITTSVAGGQGDGGNITIDPVFTVLDGGSRIIARAREGRGGNIRIVSDFLYASPESLVDASSELGVSGAVDIESPETDVVSGALALPESFLDAASLLSDRCTARAIKGASSFIVSGRGGVPPGPETVLPSFPELGLNETPEAKGSARVSEHALVQGTRPECAIE